jgi:hypothetical protein
MSDDASSVFERLLLLLGLDEAEVLHAALAAYASPMGEVFGVPTPVLSKFLKILKTQAPPESRASIEDAFMQFVTKVRLPRSAVAHTRAQWPHLNTRTPRPTPSLHARRITDVSCRCSN